MARISKLVPWVLRTRGTSESRGGPEDYELIFYYRAPLEAPALFSTAPQRGVANLDWYRRVDGGIDERGLLLVVHKTQGSEHIAPSLNDGLWIEGQAVQGYGNSLLGKGTSRLAPDTSAGANHGHIHVDLWGPVPHRSCSRMLALSMLRRHTRGA